MNLGGGEIVELKSGTHMIGRQSRQGEENQV